MLLGNNVICCRLPYRYAIAIPPFLRYIISHLFPHSLLLLYFLNKYPYYDTVSKGDLVVALLRYALSKFIVKNTIFRQAGFCQDFNAGIDHARRTAKIA